MNTFPTLYKRTSAGKIQIWFAEVEGGKYRTTSGQLEGKKTTADWTVCEAKNVGRANQKTAEEQAIAEVEAMYVKQKKRDYRDTPDEVDSIERFKPMLADKWQARRSKISERIVHVQPKFDGMRLIANAQGLWSRNGESVTAKLFHVWEHIKHLFEKQPDLILDGEMYNHDLKANFNKMMSDEGKKMAQYWVYDLPSHLGDFEQRWQRLLETVDETDILRITPTQQVSVDSVDEKAAEYIELGYEGAMVRLTGKYENKRSKTLLKWKEMQDEEFVIVDIQEGVGNRSGVAARIVLQLPNGKKFGAGPIGDFPYCLKLLQEKDLHIGKKGTVLFQNYTPDGVPRFPKFKTVRDYE